MSQMHFTCLPTLTYDISHYVVYLKDADCVTMDGKTALEISLFHKLW